MKAGRNLLIPGHSYGSLNATLCVLLRWYQHTFLDYVQAVLAAATKKRVHKKMLLPQAIFRDLTHTTLSFFASFQEQKSCCHFLTWWLCLSKINPHVIELAEGWSAKYRRLTIVVTLAETRVLRDSGR